jgi:hypothetical protein
MSRMEGTRGSFRAAGHRNILHTLAEAVAKSDFLAGQLAKQ